MNIYAQRLLNVARACRETRHAERFMMREFLHPCGTPACAVGNYAAREDLQDFIRVGETRYGDFDILRQQDDAFVYVNDYTAHFGITEPEWYELFSYNGCGKARSSIAAAEYIEAFVARKWPAPTPPNWRAISESPLIPEHVKSEDACHV